MSSRSLTALLEGLSDKFSTQVKASPIQKPEGDFSIRFLDVDQEQAFSLVTKRYWKSTEIYFVADPFASRVREYLAVEAVKKRTKILTFLAENRGWLSECELKVNGINLSNETQLGKQSVFDFRASLFVSESSLEFGLVNEPEVKLISFAIELFTILLPVPTARYTNPDEVSGYPEGAISHVLVNRYERDPRNRKLAIQIHGTKCMACGFDFEAIYGPIGRHYVVIHHTTPVSAMGPDYVVDPANDLVAICANCHAMVHRQDPPIEIEALRALLRGDVEI